MKIVAISVISLLIILAVAGCNPVGMDKTRVYVTGFVYTDITETIGAEGIGLITTGTQETYLVETDANGRFWIEIQLYPETQYFEGSIVPSGITGSVTFGLTAINEFAGEYVYGASASSSFTVFGGDTLTMYSINLAMFSAKNGSR